MAATAPAQRCFVVFTAFDFDDEPRSGSSFFTETLKDMKFTTFLPLFLLFLPFIHITATLRLKDMLSFDPNTTADDSSPEMNRVKFVGADVSRKSPPLLKHTGSTGDGTAGTRRQISCGAIAVRTRPVPDFQESLVVLSANPIQPILIIECEAMDISDSVAVSRCH